MLGIAERLADLERDVLELRHVDRTHQDQLSELKVLAGRTLVALGDLSQDAHGVDARLTVLERDMAAVRSTQAEHGELLREHGDLLRRILDRLPA